MHIPQTIEKMLSSGPMPGFEPTTVNRATYLDIMENALAGYSLEHIRSMIPGPGAAVEDIQIFTRIASLLGVLIANGRKGEQRELFAEMMDISCREMHEITGDLRVDFAVKEIMLAFIAVKDQFPAQRVARWHSGLSKVDPYRNYVRVLRGSGDEPLHNINIYNMAGEYLRELEGMTDTAEYFDRHWPHQLERFDENGMYMDPDCPTLYDLTTRCQILIMLHYGYRGKYYEALDQFMQRASFCTLLMQSAAYEFPYGGRSNQFLFNEALIAANCEYEAARYKAMGNLPLAGMFKRSAHKAVQAISRWLQSDPPRHVKNNYPANSHLGCEKYATYDKYMVTLGCFLYIAYLSAEESIGEYPCPADFGGYLFETGKDFHKLFVNAHGYSLQFDTAPDTHYDAAGLGRIHKRGVPTELALSTSIVQSPTYLIPGQNPGNLSFSPGYCLADGGMILLCEQENPAYSCIRLPDMDSNFRFQLTWGIPGAQITEQYAVSPCGIEIKAALNGGDGKRIAYKIPLFCENGGEQTRIAATDGGLTVALGAHQYRIITDGDMEIGQEDYVNRNGCYRAASLRSRSGEITIKLSLE